MPQLRQLVASGKAKLAVSLHATTDEVRSYIAPVNRKHDLAELMGALAELFPASLARAPGRSDGFVILEYVMLSVGGGARPCMDAGVRLGCVVSAQRSGAWPLLWWHCVLTNHQ